MLENASASDSDKVGIDLTVGDLKMAFVLAIREHYGTKIKDQKEVWMSFWKELGKKKKEDKDESAGNR